MACDGHDKQYSVLVQGVSRIRALSLAEEGPMLHATVVRLRDQGSIADAEVLYVSIYAEIDTVTPREIKARG